MQRSMSNVVAASILAVGMIVAASMRPSAFQASDQFIGQIAWVGFNFAPRGWARCEGQLLSISQNTALFSLLGTTYGGNGQTTFALPDMRGRVLMAPGQGPGLTPRFLGELGGQEAVTLTTSQMPAHTHASDHQHTIPALPLTVLASDVRANSDFPGGRVLAAPAKGQLIYTDGGATVPMGSSGFTPATTTGVAGGNVAISGQSLPHSSMPPYNTLTCIIALEGIFPSQNFVRRGER